VTAQKKEAGKLMEPTNTAKGRPKDPEKRIAIIRAARDLFLQHGVSDVSMEGIAREAGVAKVTIYSHFADKDALFRAVIQAETGDYQPPSPEQEARDLSELSRLLNQFGVDLIALLSKPEILALGRLLASEAMRHPEQASWFYETGPEATKKRLAKFLGRAKECGLVQIEDTMSAASQLLSMWASNLDKQQLGLAPQPSHNEIESHIAQCIDVFLRAYRKE
jgi:TetR/AcrR family transcriptional regulator, mexJK operon transcriptional repressor